ncbi:MAG: RsiV family protein [Tannerella sp.]|jgi:hypothetical protein|nr:RsiV family protein [Tannerella sp.]
MTNIETNPGCSLQIKFIYPVNFANRDVLNLLQQQFITGFFGEDYANQSPVNATNIYLEKYINNFKLQEKNFLIDQQNHQQNPNEYFNYEVLNNKIIYNKNNLISFTVNRIYYKGGVHDAHKYMNYVIDLRTGKRITEKDIFIDDYKEELASIIVHEIALQNNAGRIEDLENMGFFNIAEISPNKNFYINDDGINYTFNEFDIAAYIIGPIDVYIPYEKIQHILRKESPVSNIALKNGHNT